MTRRFVRSLVAALVRGGGYKAWAVAAVAGLALAAPAHADTPGTLSRVTGMDVACFPVIPGYPAPGQIPSGMYGTDPVTGRGQIYLTTELCSRIGLDLAGRYAHRTMARTMRGLAWRTLGHEFAHSRGYDHGATSIGADCASYRLFMRPLMRAAGLRAGYVDQLMRAVKRTGPCIPWVQL